MNDISCFDTWLNDDGPAALVIREHLVPVDGPDGVFFPATFAAEQGNDSDRFRGGYNIDCFPDGTNVCLVDTVGSQANRIEPLFLSGNYAGVVPRVVVTAGDHRFNLLEAGHRAADAIIRSSSLKDELQSAFEAVLHRNAEPLAKIAPTSLVFGVWDSRGTSAKLPRLVSSTIRAFNVYRDTRHAQYNPVIHFKNAGLLEGIDASDEDLAQKGYVSQPIGKQPTGKTDPTHGGVRLMPNGSIRRDAVLSLAALRLLAVREANGSLLEDRTLALRRYILGLALTALTAPQPAYLRQGCNLVPDEKRLREFKLVKADGTREDAKLTHADALAFCKAAAEKFGIGPERVVPFDKKLAREDIKGKSADAEKIKGEIVTINAEAKSFTLKKGREKYDVPTTETTVYLKGDDESTFSTVIVVKAKVEVELTNGTAAKVTGK